MRKKKNTIIIVLAIFLFLLTGSLYGWKFTVHAAIVDSGSFGENVFYTLSSEGLLTIRGTGEMEDVVNPRDHLLYGKKTPWDKKNVKRVVIQDGITRIGEYMFADHYYLTDIQIPNSVVSIGEGAFQYCYSLFSLRLPENLTSIPYNMCGLADLRFVYIPASVKNIGYAAFFENSILLEIEYGGTQAQWKQVTIEEYNEGLLEAHVVYNGGNILSATQSGKCGNNVTWKLSTDGTLLISGNGHMDSYKSEFEGGDGTDHPWYKYRAQIKKIIIASGVTSVGANAFFDCFNCTSLEIQNGVKIINERAFAHMPISSVSFPNSITVIGECVFSACNDLQKVKLPDGITVLNGGLFRECKNLESIILPKNLTTIENGAFYGCEFDEITIPATVTYIGGNFPHVNIIHFLGALPSFEYESAFLEANYYYCLPKYYESYGTVFQKSRAEGVLSDGSIRAKLNETSITLSVSEPMYQLTVLDEVGNATYVTKKWWVDKTEVASVDQNGVVRASGHGETMLYVEISAGGYHSMAGCQIKTNRNDLLVALLPKDIKADFPVTCGTYYGSEWDIAGYQSGKLAETDTNNEYYQELLHLTKNLTFGCFSEEQKARAIFEWVSQNITYGGAIGIGTTAEQAYAVYVNGKAHCEGYAKLTGFLLYLANIPSCLVASEGHMWNIALLDGKWTMIDSTNDKFGMNYGDYYTIQWIGFGMDEFCFVIDNTKGIKLAGVGNHYNNEEREMYTSLKVPDFVDIIFGRAFGSCKNLKNIILPKSIKEISVDAFEDCDNLTNISYAGSKAEWNTIKIGKGNENLTRANIIFNSTVFHTTNSSNHIKHTYKKVTKKASMNKKGSIVEKCSKCGHVKKKTDIPAPTKIVLSANQHTYSGKARKPSVTIYDSAGRKLSKKRSYTVSYKHNKYVGKAMVIITFKGNYKGTAVKRFPIVPKPTEIDQLIADTKSFTVTWKKKSSHVGGYQIQYSAKKNFPKKEMKIVTIEGNTTFSKKISTKKSGNYYVRVRAFKRAKSGTYYSKWSKIRSVKTW